MIRYPSTGRFADLAARLEPKGDLGALISIGGAAFTDAMGKEWASAHPDIPLFLGPEELAAMGAGGGLSFSVIVTAMERFVSDERTFDDRSAPIEAVRSTYRDVLMQLIPEYWRDLERRLGASFDDPAVMGTSAQMMLGVWPTDPREDQQAWRLWLVLGISFSRRSDPETASGYLMQSVKLSSREISALNELAACRFAQGRLDDADALLTEVLDRDPADQMALGNAAGIRLKAGRKAEALPLLERALALYPDDPFLQRLHAQVHG